MFFIEPLHFGKHYELPPSVLNCEVPHLAIESRVEILE